MSGLDLFLIEGISTTGFICVFPKSARFIFSKLAVGCDLLIGQKANKSKKPRIVETSKVIEIEPKVSPEETEIIEALKAQGAPAKAAKKAARIAIENQAGSFNEKLRKAFHEIKNVS